VNGCSARKLGLRPCMGSMCMNVVHIAAFQMAARFCCISSVVMYVLNNCNCSLMKISLVSELQVTHEDNESVGQGRF
jgi:hypothetical protein